MEDKTINKTEYKEHIHQAISFLRDDGYADIELVNIKNHLINVWELR